MPSRASADFRRALTALRQYGLLLESDPKLPSVTTLIAGAPIRGSWWGHPQGHTIFDVTRQLAAHPDVVVTKLVSGKVTFVHRQLWPALLAVGTAREAWQLQGLSRTAQSLLEIVRQDGALQTDRIPWARGAQGKSPGEAARELERALLVRSEELHTSTGAHAKRLESWERWARRVGLKGQRPTAGQAKQELSEKLGALNAAFGAKGKLPWSEE